MRKDDYFHTRKGTIIDINKSHWLISFNNRKKRIYCEATQYDSYNNTAIFRPDIDYNHFRHSKAFALFPLAFLSGFLSLARQCNVVNFFEMVCLALY